MANANEIRVGVTGSSGLVGRALTGALLNSVPLVRGRRDPDQRPGGGARARRTGYWDPADRTRAALDLSELDGSIDAIVHLAGAPLDDGRLDAAHRARVLRSRVDGTTNLVAALGALDPSARPRTLICASAVGYYGDRSDTLLDESSTSGALFLSEVCRAWEGAALHAEQLDIRVVCLRFGLVLSRHGGALARMLPAFRLGGGAALGDGSQWMSIVALDDLIAIIARALTDERLRGPVNAVCPEPVRNRDFTALLARALKRPALPGLRVPRFALRAMFGDVADEMLLASQRVLPRTLLDVGHAFKHATAAESIAASVAR